MAPLGHVTSSVTWPFDSPWTFLQTQNRKENAISISIWNILSQRCGHTYIHTFTQTSTSTENNEFLKLTTLISIQRTNNPTREIITWKIEDIFLEAIIVMIHCLNLQHKFLNERTPINGLRIRICIPCLFFHNKCRLRQYGSEPPCNRHVIGTTSAHCDCLTVPHMQKVKNSNDRNLTGYKQKRQAMCGRMTLSPGLRLDYKSWTV